MEKRREEKGRGAKYRECIIGRGFVLGVFLLAGILLGGCGKERKTEDGNSKEGQQVRIEALHEQYFSVSMDNVRLAVNDGAAVGTLGQLVKMKCLAAKGGIYVAGIRLNQGEAETAVYRIGEDRTPRLAASYPGEGLTAWCAAGEGIALLTAHASAGEGKTAEYTLRSLFPEEGGGLREAEVWPLTEALGHADATGFYVEGMAVEEGRLALLDGRDKAMMVIELSSGEMSLSVPVTENVAAVSCGGKDEVLVLTMEGTLYSYSLLTGGRKLQGEKLFGGVRGGSHYAIGQNEIYVGGNLSLYGVGIGGGQERRLLDYSPAMGPGGSLWIDEAQGAGAAVSWDEESRQVFCRFLSPEPAPDPREGRRIVTLENYRVDDELKAAATDFNRSNEEYWVEIAEAGEGESSSDYFNRLKTRLTANQGPDLLMAAGGFEYGDYVRQGILEDLGIYLQRDLNPEEYVQSALYAYEKDGGVYALGSGFDLNVYVMDGETADSLKDFGMESISKAMEEAQIPALVGNEDKNRILTFCLLWLDGEFCEENVRECILFAEKYGDGDADDSRTRRVGEEALMVGETIRTPLDIPDIQMCYGDDAVMIGGIMGYENRISLSFRPEALSINRASKNKEGAWEFIKFMLGKEYQFALKDRLPVDREAFEAMLESYRLPRTFDVYFEDINQIFPVTDKYYLKRAGAKTGMREGIDAVTPEQTRLLQEMVEKGVTGDGDREFGAEEIIYEEVLAYFRGERSLDQVMEIIMNRLNLYFQERK